jgi:hypothetical protein
MPGHLFLELDSNDGGERFHALVGKQFWKAAQSTHRPAASNRRLQVCFSLWYQFLMEFSARPGWVLANVFPFVPHLHVIMKKDRLLLIRPFSLFLLRVSMITIAGRDSLPSKIWELFGYFRPQDNFETWSKINKSSSLVHFLVFITGWRS